MINIQEIAKQLIDGLETQSVIHKVRAEGVKLLHDTIMQEVQKAQAEIDGQKKKEAEDAANKAVTGSDQPSKPKRKGKQASSNSVPN